MKKLQYATILLLLVNSTLLRAQQMVNSAKNHAQQKITGVVYRSDDGTTLPGVSIVIEGSTLGTVSNIEGNYAINYPGDSAVLVFKAIGFYSTQRKVGNDTLINVALEPENYMLDEVVVMGYGSTIRSQLTGSITKVKGESLQKVPAPTFEEALQGKAPGVFMVNSTGKLGESFNINIRGKSSIGAGNQPLYIVDGVIIQSNDMATPINQPLNLLMTINPHDIETIEILKDASASSIYGSRGSNGVVIINTKSGSYGQKSKVNVGVSYAISKETNRLDLLNANEYVELMSEAIVNSYDDEDGVAAIMDAFQIDTIINYDWQDEIYRGGKALEIYMNASGGTEKSNYYTGFTYSDQQGVLIGNNLKKLNGKLKYSNKINDFVEFTANFDLAHTDMDRVDNDNAYSTPMQMVAQPPIISPYLEDGEPNPDGLYYNSLLSLKYNEERNRLFRSLANLDLDIHILPRKLWFTTTVGSDIIYQKENSRLSPKTDAGGAAGAGEYRTVNNNNISIDNYFTYKETLSSHDFNIALGTSYQQNLYERAVFSGEVFPGDAYLDLDAAAENIGFGSLSRKTVFQSLFARGSYSYYDKYLLTASFRSDGSSKFGKDQLWGNFASASIGWIVSQEAFMENIPVLSFLKPRFSIGTTGNAGIPDFQHLSLATPLPYTRFPGVSADQLGITGLGWEKTTQMDLGVDFGFLDNRIYGEIDFYSKKTDDLLLFKPLPMTSGYSGVYENVGAIENRGVEIFISGKPMTGMLKWDVSFNVATNTNEVTRLNNILIYGVNAVEEGKPLGFFYLPEYAGVDPQTGDALYYTENGEKTPNYEESAFKMVGNPNPKWHGGLSNILKYENFDLNVFFQFVSGIDVYKADAKFMSSNGKELDNQTKDQLDRWQKPGDITDVPQARYNVANGSYPSSRYVYDASYMRLKDFTLGYTLPLQAIHKARLSFARVYVSAKNVLTFTQYKGADPEVSSPNAGQSTTAFTVEQGIDYYSMPQAKSITFGIQMTF
jgi:TonB-dependent starch-binding outer membrane protein SusC